MPFICLARHPPLRRNHPKKVMPSHPREGILSLSSFLGSKGRQLLFHPVLSFSLKEGLMELNQNLLF